MNWRTEVQEAARYVLPELTSIELALVQDVPILAVDVDGSAWGRYYRDDRASAKYARRIEIYRDAFDMMPDPENRAVQLRDVIRHELQHALGEWHSDYGENDTSEFRKAWVGHNQVTYRKDGLVVTLPARI